ncbi:MAG: glycerol kinase [Candidatus Pelagibacter sp. TMED118]|nr:MAG: glycerol kinase [Candidatus Pelagibacter sp. TMED118]
MKKFIISIDQGTTSTRSILFDTAGRQVFISQKELKQYFPKNGWVEHDPEEIWRKTNITLKEVISKSRNLGGKILTIGITNQRETTLVWDKQTGKCLYNAIVWQDRRTLNFCSSLKKKGLEKMIKFKTGLLLDPYFSSSKIKWIIDNVSPVKKLIKKNRILFGTIDTFLIWKLTKGKLHATDATNASRTMLYNIKTNKWDKKILKIFKIPYKILPEIKNSADDFGFTDKSVTKKSYSIRGVIGDQQAAAIGQGCFLKGSSKITYGTGAFLISNTGNKIIHSKNKLLSTVCYRINNKTTYAVEGSIYIAGAVIQWLRDNLKIITSIKQSEIISKKLKSNNGVYFVPAFTGLGAPYWNSEARGIITGLKRDTLQNDFVRAALEAVVYQSIDLFRALKNDGIKMSLIKVDGGMVQNNWFNQFLADVSGLKVLRPHRQETTALGAALIAGLGAGIFKSFSEIIKKNRIKRQFLPKINRKSRLKLLNGWHQAIRKTMK